MRVSVAQACELLADGQPVGVPTETVYGLAACADDEEAIDKVFHLKKRPRDNPLIVHLSSREEISRFAEVSDSAEELMEAFWPGPLTLVLPVKDGMVSGKITCGLPTAAFRVPSHPKALEIIRCVGPLVMPSANLSGRPSATKAVHIEQDFGDGFPVVDGGASDKGLESTILMEKEGEWIILREGAVTAEGVGFVVGYLPVFSDKLEGGRPLCPGQMYRHYAPKARLIVGGVPQTETVVGFSDRIYECRQFFSFGDSRCAEGVAARLYSCLRELDEAGVEEAWVDMDFPHEGLWKAIRNRLNKAGK